MAIVKNNVSYFPSTLLEAGMEGAVLGLILLYIIRNKTFPGQVATSFLIGYGVFRFIIEFVRLPDSNIGYIAFGWVTMGHILSLPMAII